MSPLLLAWTSWLTNSRDASDLRNPEAHVTSLLQQAITLASDIQTFPDKIYNGGGKQNFTMQNVGIIEHTS